MVELHLHLDGSLSKEDFEYLSKKNKVDLGNDFPSNIHVSDECTSLDEYLKCFALPIKLMQDADSLSYVAYSLVKRLHNEGIIYAEIRFAPGLHTQKGLTQYEVTEAVLDGLNKGIKECNGIEANLILCLMRHFDLDTNFETVEVAKRLKNKRVVAIDLAGGEVGTYCKTFKKCFDYAKENHINITIHAGEASGHQEIVDAIEMGAQRIGHGIHLQTSLKDVKDIVKNKICFEFCPTSNLQTKSLLNYSSVPLLDFIEKGIKVTLNSDNITVSNTSVIKEFHHMISTFKITEIEVKELLMNSIKYSFANIRIKKKLCTLIEKTYLDYYFKAKNL